MIDPATQGSEEPAFPTTYGSRGMSLRDWFAGVALQGMLSCEAWFIPENDAESTLAAEAYRYADAMLAERQKKS